MQNVANYTKRRGGRKRNEKKSQVKKKVFQLFVYNLLAGLVLTVQPFRTQHAHVRSTRTPKKKTSPAPNLRLSIKSLIGRVRFAPVLSAGMAPGPDLGPDGAKEKFNAL